MNTGIRSTVVGVFADRDHARQAIDELRRLGFPEDQIGVIVRNRPGPTPPPSSAGPVETGSKWEEGAATGIVAGTGVGALWALGIAAGVLPGIGPVLFGGGLLASLVASAAAGAAVAGVVGALVGLGIPEDEAQFYEQEFQAGRTLVTVKAQDRSAEVWEIMRRHGAYDVTLRGTTTAPAAPLGQEKANY
jgi:hypothetical protein